MSKNRSVIVIAVLVAALSAALLLIGLEGRGQAASPGTHPPSPSEKQSTGAPQAAGQPQPEADPESEQPQSEPAADPQPEPAADPQPEPGVLFVGPADVDLADGQWTAQFVVVNVGASDMSWFAVGVPSEVGLSETEGTLAAGTETVVTATIDHTQLAKGPFSLTLHVSANDTAESVTITGVKKVKAVGPVGPGDLSNG